MKLPNLEDLEIESNENNEEDLKEINMNSPSNINQLPAFEDFEEDDEIDRIHQEAQNDLSDKQRDTQFIEGESVDEIEDEQYNYDEIELNQNEVEDYDEQSEMGNDDEQSEDELEEEFIAEDLLPGVNFEDGEKDDSEELENSDADEKAKEFFMNMKDRISSLFKKRPKSPNEEKLKPKGESKGRPKGKLRKPIISSTVKSYSIVIIVVILILGCLYYFWNKSYEDMNDINVEASLKGDDSSAVTLSEFDFVSEDELEFSIENLGDMSTNITIYATISAKSNIPFMNDKIQCESDIVYLELGSTGKEKFYCNEPINKDTRYKVKVDLDGI